MRPSFFTALTRLILFLLAPGTLLLIALGCGTPPRSAPPAPSPTTVSSSGTFVGNAACAECHRAEFDLHRLSRHANTMHAVATGSREIQAPPPGPIADSGYAVREAADGLHFGQADQPDAGAVIRYALGSGKDAVTYVGAFSTGSLTEFRMTYLPARRSWCVTPGQGTFSNLELGKVHELGMARRCILCHAVQTAPGAVEPAQGFLGVGCEACHGAGGAHVAAMKMKSKSDQSGAGGMEDMRRLPAAQIDAVCSRCHRGLDDVPIEKEVASLTARFQGYGLEQSPCYRKSDGRLSCITCHNPHTNVSMDRRAYERVCLSCHATTGSGHDKPCPVNPREGCIPCHMPARPIFPNRRIPISMADHRISAYRSGRR